MKTPRSTSKGLAPKRAATKAGTGAVLRIKDAKAWAMLMAPIRVEIAEMLRCMGPSSIAELAQNLARPADTLYRHMELLEKAGLVHRSTVRRDGKRSEAIFEFVASDVAPGFAPDRKGQQALLAMTNTFFRAAVHAIKDGAAAQRLRFGDLPAGESPNFSILYELGWLTPESLKQARSLLAQLKDLMDEGKRKGEGELYMSVAVLAPMTRKHTRAGKPAMPTAVQRAGDGARNRSQSQRR